MMRSDDVTVHTARGPDLWWPNCAYWQPYPPAISDRLAIESRKVMWIFERLNSEATRSK